MSDYILSIALTHLGSYIVFKIILQIAMRFRSQLTIRRLTHIFFICIRFLVLGSTVGQLNIMILILKYTICILYVCMYAYIILIKT